MFVIRPCFGKITINNKKEAAMIFKSSTVALVVSSALAFTVNAENIDNAVIALSVGDTSSGSKQEALETQRSFQEANAEKGVYLIRLSQKSALDNSYSNLGENRTSIVAAIDKQQASVISLLKQLDGGAILTRKARLTENALYVQTTKDAIKALENNQDIIAVELLSDTANYTSEDEFSGFPFLKIKDPGDSVTVAIVGNGIDYTHAALGGTGTSEAYEKAWANKSNAWDGFPTDTVIGGLDFSADAEGYHTIDYNPIEAVDDVNVETGALPSGTAIAAKILEQAPEAKILAYKTYDWANAYFFPVLDVIIDPNQDGDISDRPDVIVLNGWGNGAFYVEDDTNGSGATREVGLVRRLSAAGSLVVVGAGQTYYNSYFNLAWRGAVPEALTVGSVKLEDETIKLSEFTPAGPTRGTHQLKPEVVAPAENIVAALVGSGDKEQEFMAHSTYAAAYAAGGVAKILANYPHLSPLEAKALLANTAKSEGVMGGTSHNAEFDRMITTVAEVPFMGTGLVDGDHAVTADAVVWDSATYQPALPFGFVEVASSAAVSRDVTIKNLTDELQTYTLSTFTHGEKSNNSAVSFIYPEKINVPANHSVVFNVTMMLDASKLTEQGMLNSEDYTIENFTKENVNGYLVFDNVEEDSAQLKMSWQVFPKNAEKLLKSGRTDSWQMPYEAQAWQEKLWAANAGANSDMITIQNGGVSPKTIYSIPLMKSVAAVDPSKAGGQGHMLKNLGASIVNDAQCASGSKLTVAVQMFDKFDIPMAEHFDKAGHLLTYFSIFTAEYVDRNGGDPLAIDQDQTRTDNDILAYIEVAMDDDGKPQVEFIDYDQEYEWWNPRKRFVNSSLGADVSIGDDTLIANVCLDELFHDDLQSVDDWDGDLGWQFATDRDARANFDETLIRYNPLIMGRSFTETIDHTGEYNYPAWTFTHCDPNGVDWMGNPFPENYCIEVKDTFVGQHTGIAKYVEDAENNTVWSNKVVLQPQEMALVSVTMVDDCNPNLIRFEPFTPHKDCPPGVMIVELGSDNTAFSNTNYGADLGVKSGQAFSVYENAENGTVIGKIAKFAENFFSEDEYQGPIYLVNALPGTPFHVATDGTLSVANSAALDYEQNKSFTLKVHADYTNRDTQVVDLVVYLNNRNDIAPEMTQALPKSAGKVGESISTSVASSFTDAEGDGISFVASGLPSGLVMSRAGEIQGQFEAPGQFQVTLTASDGINSSSTNFDVTVEQSNQSSAPIAAPENETAQSSGGSTGIFFLMLSALVFAHRQVFRQARRLVRQ